MGAYVKHVRDAGFHPGEGHLYRAGGKHYLIYTGVSRELWDVCETEPEKLPFGPMLIPGATSRDAAVEALRALLNPDGLPRSKRLRGG